MIQVVAYWAGTFRATAEAAYVLRGEMAAIARRCGLDDERVNDVKLAVSEAVTNAVRHAYPADEPGDVTGAAHIADGKLLIVISDDGCGMKPRPDSPGLGLGLPIIAQLSESVEIVGDGPGTEIHMTFPCHMAAGELTLSGPQAPACR